jgi:ribose transport system ATP-binding protein
MLNIRHILLATAPLAMVAMAQFNVLLVRGFDVSVGSLMSLIVVAASFLVGYEMGPVPVLLGILACLAIGLAVGATNGAMVRYAKVNPVITTIAMLSVLQGVALMLRPRPDGIINQEAIEVLRFRIGEIPASAFFLVALAVGFDLWLHRSRSGLRLKAVGFREEAAKRNGVPVHLVHLRAYIFSSLLATLAGFFLASEVGIGHPTAGGSYALASIAAAVLGGAALTGGRGSFSGALFGAFFFALTVNVVSLVGFNTAVGVIASGALTLIAVFLYSGLRPAEQAIRRLMRRLRRSPAAAAAQR